MSGPNDLATLGDALAWLGLTSDDGAGTVARLITAASSSIQKYLGYNIAVASYNDVYNGVGSYRQMLRNRPVVSVSSVTLIVGAAGLVNIPPRTSTPPGSTGQAGFTFDDRCVYLDPPYSFEKGLQNIQIAYQAGYATVPADLEQACLQWLQTLYMGSAAGGGILASVLSAKAGDHALTFGNMITKLSTGSIPIPPQILMQIQPYIRVSLV
jgi:hypothetical protein